MKEIQGLELYTYDEVVDLIRDFIESTLRENGYSRRDISINDIRLHGSRLRNQAREDSDLDAAVEYTGDIREDDLFDMLHEDPLYIDDVEVDVNPINSDDTDIEDYMKQSAEYDRKKLSESLDDRVSRLERLVR